MPDQQLSPARLLVESGAIFLSVLLAFAVEQWREERNDIFLDERNAQIRFNDGEQYLSGFIYYINRANGNEPRAMAHVQAALDRLTGSTPAAD